VYHTLGKIIKSKFGGDATLIGDEGGFAPPCDNREGCELIMEAIKMAGYDGKCTIGLDVAASEFKVKGQDAYDLDFKYDGNVISGTELGDLYRSLAADFPIVTIEDPFDEDDWQNWSKFTAKSDFQVVGDDLTVTNIEKIGRAINEKACTCLLLKVNQIGSVSESIAAVAMAKRAGWGVMTSHRSGETEDTYIADLAVGLCTGQIKTVSYYLLLSHFCVCWIDCFVFRFALLPITFVWSPAHSKSHATTNLTLLAFTLFFTIYARVLLADQNVWPSTISCSASKKSWDLETLSTPEQDSVKRHGWDLPPRLMLKKRGIESYNATLHAIDIRNISL
jgi:Enolase, C-terminal TIM barrel domain